VFARPEGTPTHPDLFSKTFDRMVARSGLPAIRLHDLRHIDLVPKAAGTVVHLRILPGSVSDHAAAVLRTTSAA
jgi:hypothetical protein